MFNNGSQDQAESAPAGRPEATQAPGSDSSSGLAPAYLLCLLPGLGAQGSGSLPTDLPLAPARPVTAELAEQNPP